MTTTQEANKLIELRAGKGLESGLMPSVLPSAGSVWRMGKGVWFQDTHIENILGMEHVIPVVHRKSQCLAQAYVGVRPRLYVEDLGIISYYENETEGQQIIGSLDPNGSFDMQPWGTWLALTDNITKPKLWKDDGAGFYDIGSSEFTRAKILKKLGQYLLAFNTDTYPSGYHWSDASAPEIWTPTLYNTAGNAPIRDLDSDIVAVADLGAALAMYSREYLMLVQYVGYPDVFGTPNQALSGVGSASKWAIISLGRENWGLCRGGIFVTNGATVEYIDKPAVSKWLQENLDWDREDEVTSYYDEQMGLAIWSIPTTAGSFQEIAVSPKTRKFTFVSDGFGAALDRGVFGFPIVGRADGIFRESVYGQKKTDFFLASQLWAGGNQHHFKAWNYMMFEGVLPKEAQVRFGFTDEMDMTHIEWQPWTPITYRLPIAVRESVFLAIEIKSKVPLSINAITVFGDMAGPVG